MGSETGLTERQIEIMNLVKLGYANRQIARKLWITIDTVGLHLKAVNRRVQANDRAHAVCLCMKMGIID